MKRATVELDHNPLPAVAHILKRGPASRGAAGLALTTGQAVRPLDPMQVAPLQHRTGAVAQIREHCLQHAPAANALASRQHPQYPLRSGPPTGAQPCQYGECGCHVLIVKFTADHVNQRVLQANCRRAAVEFGALFKVRRPVQHDSWQGPQIASRPHSDVHDRRRRIGQRRRVGQRGRPERQHRSPLPLCLCEPAAVVHVDTPVNVDQFATAQQSGDVVIGAGGSQHLATRNDAVLRSSQVLDMPEVPTRHTGKREPATTDGKAAATRCCG